jgi:anti-sigma B factor antagonist
MEDYRRIDVSILTGSAGNILVVDLLEQRLIDPHAVRQAFNEVASALQSQSATKNVVLDLSRLQYLSSSALNRLIDLRDEIVAAGGKLRLCGLRPDVAEIFHITRLDQQFDIAPDQSAALTGF